MILRTRGSALGGTSSSSPSGCCRLAIFPSAIATPTSAETTLFVIEKTGNGCAALAPS